MDAAVEHGGQRSPQGPNPVLPSADIELPIRGPGSPARPPADMIAALNKVSSATASAVLHKLGVRQTFIEGPTSLLPGSRIVGPVLTLQFMPQREDVASGLAQEDVEKRTALWAVLEEVAPGDILAVQAFGDPFTGCLGEMLLRYLRGRGAAGVVVDGHIRDWPRARDLGLPVWARGATPNYASQGGLFPWAHNVPIACSRVLVLPGDLMIADDDGAVCVPAQLAGMVVEIAGAHEEWEAFSRMRLDEGGALSRYYPLDADGRREYEAWRAGQADASTTAPAGGGEPEQAG